MKKWLKVLIGILLFFIVAIIIFSWTRFKDRHPGYNLTISYADGIQKGFSAGFSKVEITPQEFDTWTDTNGDARFNEEDGDFFNDDNNNGKFDPIWLAGFHQNRPASGVNDPLWARTAIFDNGSFRLAFCVIDMLNFGNDEVIHIRKNLDPSWKIDYLIISSTHVHSAPDLMGMYGPNAYTRGVNKEYLEFVNLGILFSIEEAVNNLQAAEFKVFEDDGGALEMVGDTRDPQVFDEKIRVLQVLNKEDQSTLGTLLNWGNHPETLWSGNTHISSDFPHYFRKYMEEGISWGDSLYFEGLGGVSIFVNGALGGLMTTHPSIPIHHPFTGEELLEPINSKIDAQGMALAKMCLEMIRADKGLSFEKANFQLEARSVALPLNNKLFWLGAWTGIFDRGFVRWGMVRSEVAAWQLGPVSFVHFPGELYPEILNGGVESPEGADYGIDPVEIPAIRSQMPGQVKFFSGMSNDMIGYIIPKSQWDAKPPFTYGLSERPYGEINSLGPETAPILHRSIMELLEKFK